MAPKKIEEGRCGNIYDLYSGDVCCVILTPVECYGVGNFVCHFRVCGVASWSVDFARGS
ncbi:unnamed protein product [Sphenostylis stenocarpa]|uniref:Uncharacterized protein n=1 Tax=Sphenostylis stenocarpa TaxID=92480 RepID=A0AA86VAM5_9FABA|nr:unnamed protein product [Sphenostylis stenocarpa]